MSKSRKNTNTNANTKANTKANTRANKKKDSVACDKIILHESPEQSDASSDDDGPIIQNNYIIANFSSIPPSSQHIANFGSIPSSSNHIIYINNNILEAKPRPKESESKKQKTRERDEKLRQVAIMARELLAENESGEMNNNKEEYDKKMHTLEQLAHELLHDDPKE